MQRGARLYVETRTPLSQRQQLPCPNKMRQRSTRSLPLRKFLSVPLASRRRERRRQAKSAQNELRPALRGRPARRGLAPPDPRRPAPLFDRASGPHHAHALAPALAHRRGRAARRAARGPSPYATARSNPARAIWASGLRRASTAHKPPRSRVHPRRPATRPTLGPPPRPEQVSRGKRRTAPASTAGCCARAAAASTASPTPTRCAVRSSRPFPRRRRSRR